MDKVDFYTNFYFEEPGNTCLKTNSHALHHIIFVKFGPMKTNSVVIFWPRKYIDTSKDQCHITTHSDNTK